MCGITGLIERDRHRAVDRSALAAMTEVIAHRGPDGQGVETFGNVGLGNRRLAIIDRAGGDQPMRSSDGDLTITYNGELYNYRELRADLTDRGFRFRTQSDTEVMLGLYAVHGLDMFRHTNGMFAFAIWDSRERRLVLARDRFGEKPLYWHAGPERVAFASEIKSLLKVPGVRATPDWDGVHEYLTFQYCLAERTLFEGVRKIPPASFLVLGDRGEVLDQREYWSLGFEEDHATAEEAYVDELRSILEDAVRIRLRSDVPVGTYLSGGLDSSAIASVAARITGNGLPAFTGTFAEGEQYDELPYARAVADSNGSTLHVVTPTSDDFAQRFRQMIWHMDEPAAGPGAFPQLMVSDLAARNVRVVLGGQGGDELFGGYARYLMLYLEESIRGSIFESQDPGKHVVTLAGMLPNLSMLQQYVPLLKRFWAAGLFEDIEHRYYRLITRDPDLGSHFTPEFLAGRDESAIYGAFEGQFNDILERVPSGGSALFNRMTAYDSRTLLQSLLHVEDRMSMAMSLESRLPLLDHRIAELAFRMPPLYKYRDGHPKAALRTAVSSYLPPQVLARKDKMGFPVPFVEWAGGPLRPFIRDTLLGEAARERGIYDMAGIERLIDGESPYGRELWGLLCLETWFQVFIDA
jgi:asparagine synthase (glutamine-hydrolysing)